MSGDHIAIAWDAARSANLQNWEDRVPLHEQSYGIDQFENSDFLSAVVRTDLAALAPYLPNGSVDGLDVCHLQCHIGTDTVSLARAGARVTGVDFSPTALRSATELAERIGVQATWVETDVLDARAAVTGDFDLVYTSIGTITWLPDLDRWAAQIAALLRSGGTFYIRDGHPALYSIDENADSLQLRYPYFSGDEPQVWDDASTYSGDGTVAHPRTYEWAHPLSDMVNALIGAGLRILRLDEHTTLPWRFSPRMVEVPGGFAWPEGERDRVPCTYSIVARKDAATA